MLLAGHYMQRDRYLSILLQRRAIDFVRHNLYFSEFRSLKADTLAFRYKWLVDLYIIVIPIALLCFAVWGLGGMKNNLTKAFEQDCALRHAYEHEETLKECLAGWQQIPFFQQIGVLSHQSSGNAALGLISAVSLLVSILWTLTLLIVAVLPVFRLDTYLLPLGFGLAAAGQILKLLMFLF